MSTKLGWSRVFEVADKGLGTLNRLGFETINLAEEKLLEAACKATGLYDFGDKRFREGFSVLIKAYRKEAELSPLGKIVTRADTLRLLSNRLQLVENRKRIPAIAKETFEDPIVIIGLPRCGTTFLHRLLGQDPANRVPLTWETMIPSPESLQPKRTNETAPRIQKVAQRLKWFGRLAPEYRKIHRTGTNYPQECISILSHSFQSVRFHRTHFVPSYWRWLHQSDNRFAYREHRAFLQHLQYFQAGNQSKRWILKTPAHTFFVEALLEVYPAARFIQTHREPITALASNASQIKMLRKVFSHSPKKSEAGRIVKDWSKALDRLTNIRQKIGEERFLDLHYSEVASEPMAIVRKIYDYFGFELKPEQEARMKQFCLLQPKGKYGVHSYTPTELGFNWKEHGPAFDSYRERFNIPSKSS